MYARWIKTTVHSTQAVCCLFGGPTVCTLLSPDQRKRKFEATDVVLAV